MSEDLENREEEVEETSDGSDWWKTVLGGVFMFALAGFLWWYFSDFEETGGRRRMNAIIAVLYNVGGKNLACGIVAGIGAILVGWGLWDFTKFRKNK